MISKDFYRPNTNGNRDVEDRKEKFSELNAYVMERGGWLVSVPGDPAMRFDALPGSPLPAQLAALGYIVERIGQSQRILAHAVSQKFEVSSSGALVAATEGSTKPVTLQVTNAGIATVEMYDLRAP
jgi:hypothetical protein